MALYGGGPDGLEIPIDVLVRSVALLRTGGVLVMEHGEIIEDDAPDVLIAGTGKFAKLHAAWRESLV